MTVILVRILTTKPLISIKWQAGERAGGHEQGRVADLNFDKHKLQQVKTLAS
jgi:hypothetical protein